MNAALDWLLEPTDPGVHYLALRDLAGLPADAPELLSARQAAHRHGPIALVLDAMDPAGYWAKPGPGYNPKYTSTVWSIILLAQLGACIEEDPRIATACAYLLENNLNPGGQFSTGKGPSGTVDCVQGNLTAALVEMGCRDPRLEKAYEWIARSVTGAGVAPITDRKAPVRYYSYKHGPGFLCAANNYQPCAWGAVKIMLALAACPPEWQTPLIQAATQQGVDFLLSIDPAQATYPTFTGGAPSGNWWKFGFPVFYITDLLQILEALAPLGLGADPRLKNAIAFIQSRQDAQGRWLLEYNYTGKTWGDFGPKKQPNKWVTLRALRVLQTCH